jgi:glycerol-3-phosphate dehydrogenase
MLNVGIVGGGINGMCIAWQLVQAGHKAFVYEKNTLMSGTSSASSKLLHGGLRYLENFEFRLVKESLRERNQWLTRAPHLVKPLQFILPVYKHSRRSRLAYAAGLKLYDLLASSSAMPKSRWVPLKQVKQTHPQLCTESLLGAFTFWDVQMDDAALGQWVAGRAISLGATVHEYTPVTSIGTNGSVQLITGQTVQHDIVVNAAGPWAQHLAAQSGIKLEHELDLVRGSHLLIDCPCSQAWMLEVPNERRIFFVLPWKQQTLLGTTEVRHGMGEPVICSSAERDYLLKAYEKYFPSQRYQVVGHFSGLRPLLKSAADPNQATREYAIEQQSHTLTVLGGKWTTAVALAGKVCQKLSQQSKYLQEAQ